MEQLKNRAIALILAIALVFAALWIIGVGAAIPIPANLFKSLYQISALLAVVLVDLVTIALPVVALFLVFAVIMRWLIKTPDASCYFLLLLPLPLMELYFFVSLFDSLPLLTEARGQSLILTSSVVTLQRLILQFGCFYLLIRANKTVVASA